MALCAVVGVAPAAASPDGSGESFWGPIPPPGPETTAVFPARSRAAWEWPLYGTYRAVGFPLQLATLGVQTTVVALEETHVLDTIGELFGATDLPYGFRVSVDAGSFTGGAVGATFFHEDLTSRAARLQIKTTFGEGGRSRLSAGLLFGQPRRGFLDLGLGYRKDGEARFYGLGPTSRESDLARFTDERAWIGGTWRRGLGAGFAVEGLGLYTTLRNRGPIEEDDPSIRSGFEGRLPTGLRDPSDGFDLALGVLHDDTVTDGRPNTGGIRRFKVGWFVPTTEDNGFFHTRADLTHFQRLWWGRSLALRGTWAWLDANDGAVHFQRQFRTDRPDEIRGFAPRRFRGRGLTLFSAEYRFPTWAYRDTKGMGVDTYLFFDWGQAFDTRHQIAFRNFREGYGAGFRWVSRDGFGGSLELAFSDEEFVLRLRTDQNFQYAKHGFYHGRVPVPSY